NREYLQARQNERAELARNFDDDLKRYRELKGIDNSAVDIAIEVKDSAAPADLTKPPAATSAPQPNMGAGRYQALISVRTPSSVNSASRTACSTRPSTMCAVLTPEATASRAQNTFGNMPP